MKTIKTLTVAAGMAALGVTGVCVALGFAPLWSLGLAGVVAGIAVSSLSVSLDDE